MRRFAVFLAPLVLAGIALAGCSSSGGNGGSPANLSVTVSGSFGKQPKVSIPREAASGSLRVQTVIKGHGAAVTSKDAVLGNYVVYIWSGTTHKLAQSTYTSVPALFAGHLLPGLSTALRDTRVGSRVLAVLPPRYGYGSQGNSQAGVKPTDTLVFVVDVVQAFADNASVTGKTISTGGHGLPTVTPGNPPTITIPRNAKPPSTLVTKTLIQGSGPVLTSGQYVVVQYVGVNWRTGQVFDASEKDGAPFGFVLNSSPAEVIPGWNTGLLGKAVGSRVMLVIPPKDGYGSAGSSSAGIRGTDTLVFVIDVLGAVSPQTA